MSENLKLEDIKKEVYSLFLPTVEEDDQVKDLIEKAYRLGWENGYDNAKTEFTKIFMNLQIALPENKND